MNASAARPRRWKEARRSWAAGRDASGRAPRPLNRALRQVVATAIIMVVGGSASVLACPMCFGAEETALIDGTKLGIIAMLGITLAVQGGFVGFFLYLRNCAKRAAEIELDSEWSELQRR